MFIFSSVPGEIGFPVTPTACQKPLTVIWVAWPHTHSDNWSTEKAPSKHVGSDSHLIRIGSEALARSRLVDPCTLPCFQTGSIWPKSDSQPDPNLTWAAFIQYDPGHLWKNATESESRKLAVDRIHPARNLARWFLHTVLLLDRMRFAKTWPGHADQIWVSFAQYGLGLLWENETALDVVCQIQHIYIIYTMRPDYGCMLAVMAITGQNQKASKSDLAYLLGKVNVCAV